MWPDNTLGESSKTAEISKAGKGVGGGKTAKISEARKQKGIVARKNRFNQNLSPQCFGAKTLLFVSSFYI